MMTACLNTGVLSLDLKKLKREIIMNTGTLKRLAAFTNSPEGGNPAGVWIGDTLPESDEMQRIAKEVGFSETAFVAPRTGVQRNVRYYSPEAEVPFCGHATIATGVALGEANGDDTYLLATTVGEIPVVVRSQDKTKEASLTSVAPKYELAPEKLVNEALGLLGWTVDDLDYSIPPARAYAGNWHLVLAVSTRARLNSLQYDFEKLKSLMLEDDLTTLQLIWRESGDVFHSRNPFPVGGVVEDPATGAAAAALGGYLREANLVSTPSTMTIHQGEVMGRPSRLVVDIPHQGGIVVTGTAVRI
jgi:PhzF family phenazine biosynthesis protein